MTQKSFENEIKEAIYYINALENIEKNQFRVIRNFSDIKKEEIVLLLKLINKKIELLKILEKKISVNNCADDYFKTISLYYKKVKTFKILKKFLKNSLKTKDKQNLKTYIIQVEEEQKNCQEYLDNNINQKQLYNFFKFNKLLLKQNILKNYKYIILWGFIISAISYDQISFRQKLKTFSQASSQNIQSLTDNKEKKEEQNLSQEIKDYLVVEYIYNLMQRAITQYYQGNLSQDLEIYKEYIPKIIARKLPEKGIKNIIYQTYKKSNLKKEELENELILDIFFKIANDRDRT